MANEKSPTAPPKKPQGPIRWNAIIPFAVICALIGLYMHFFFDANLRTAIEWAGYKALGVEVDVAKIETSFFNASISIKGIELTDSEKPTQDAVKIGDIRFSILWDALLRARAVINEAAIEQIEFAVPRKHPGKVKPPEPPSNKPSAVAEQAEKLKQQALQQVQEDYNDNVLGDVVAMLGGNDPNAQMKQLEGSLPSKAMLEKFQADFKVKQQAWNERLKSLPQGKEIQALGDRLNKIKYKDFKSPQELQQSLQELNDVYKDADTKYKQIQSTSNDLNKDIKDTDAQYKVLEEQIKKDVKELENHFHIPKIDAKSLSRSIFKRYMSPYLAKINKYHDLAEKYLPPKFLKKGQKEVSDDDVAIQAHPREKGITYEFGRPNSYPWFWVKRTAISSQAGLTPYSGNVKGEILNITSNQKLTRKPTVLTLQGDFPAQELSGLLLQVSLDNTKPESEIKYQVAVNSYALSGKDLVSSPEVNIAFEKAYGSMTIQGHMIGLKNFSMTLNNQFKKIDYKISAKNQVAEQILKAVFAGIPVVTLEAKSSGILPAVSFDVQSNLGPELQKGFEKQIQAKIEEAKKKIQAFIDDQIGKQKAQVESQINSAKNQVNGEVQKVQAQLDAQKKQVEGKTDQAKKDISKQGQKKLEDESKKALDSLKKGLGW